MLANFIPEGVLDRETASFDIDVSFVEAPWPVKWRADATLPFTRDDGQIVQLAAMGTEAASAVLHETDGFLAVELPLRGDDLAVMFVMPKPETYARLDELTGALTTEELAAARADAIPVVADVEMPLVDIDSVTIDYFLPLGFACDRETSLRRVLHGATVQIDEKGIKAAAATASEGGADCSGGSTADVSIVLDRPFLFFVYDRPTQFVLYSGRFAG